MNLEDVPDRIRDTAPKEIWGRFGEDIQAQVMDEHQDDVEAVVVALTVTVYDGPDVDGGGDYYLSPSIAWAVDDVDATEAKLADFADAVVTFRSAAPGVDKIGRRVADALEDAA